MSGEVEMAAQLAAAMEHHPGVVLRLDAYHAFTLCALLQLANRHPGIEGSQLSVTLRDTVESIQAGLGEPLATIITAGWDPGLDMGPAL